MVSVKSQVQFHSFSPPCRRKESAIIFGISLFLPLLLRDRWRNLTIFSWSGHDKLLATLIPLVISSLKSKPNLNTLLWKTRNSNPHNNFWILIKRLIDLTTDPASFTCKLIFTLSDHQVVEMDVLAVKLVLIWKQLKFSHATNLGRCLERLDLRFRYQVLKVAFQWREMLNRPRPDAQRKPVLVQEYL